MNVEFSVIVATHLRADHLSWLLQDFSQQESPAADVSWEIIVVDNVDDAETARVVNDHAPRIAAPVLYVVERRTGLSHARNTGLAATRHDFVVLMDDDLRIPSDWVAQFADVLRETGADCICPRMTTPIPPDAPAWLIRRLSTGVGQFDLGESNGWIPPSAKPPVGACCGFSRRMFEECGPFQTELGRRGQSLFCGEETLFFLNMKTQKPASYYVGKIHVHHPLSADKLTRRYWLRHGFDTGRSAVRMGALQDRPMSTQAAIDSLCKAIARQCSVVVFWHKWFECQYWACWHFGRLYEFTRLQLPNATR